MTSLRSKSRTSLHSGVTPAPRNLFNSEQNVFLLEAHYGNAKKWIGNVVSELLRNKEGTCIVLSNDEAKDLVKKSREMQTFISVFDKTGEAFESFWVLDEKVHGKDSRTGGLLLYHRKLNEQTGQMSKKAVGNICNMFFGSSYPIVPHVGGTVHIIGEHSSSF